ncbi:polysaccharide deacetylase family protein, partial [Dokdonella sp.]|uniref:polysaccharide deacetylase family protein n=1 Tax=Dokdonella sp. TaxID=2291710 RepID=UPI003C45D883
SGAHRVRFVLRHGVPCTTHPSSAIAHRGANHIHPEIELNPRPNKLKLLKWLPDSWMVTTGVVADRSLHLTFDDGPNLEHTPRLLDLLASHDAKATFFLLGEQIEKHPDIVERLVAEGHQLGNHSYDHPRFTRIPRAEQLDQIERTERLLSKYDGKPRHRFRPPSGRFPLSLLAHFAVHPGSMAYWSYDSLDYQQKPASELIEVMRNHPPRPGDIILMHDDSEATIDALAVMLPEWHASGFRLATLPELPVT